MSVPTDDRMTMTVLADGTVRVEVDGISGANHMKADQLVAYFSKLMGTEVTITKRKRHGHHHHTTTVHKHQGS